MKPTPSVPLRSNQLKPCLERELDQYAIVWNLNTYSHGIHWLQHLLGRCLQRKDCVWCIVELFDLLWVRDEDVSIIRSRHLEWLSVRLIEGILDHVRTPEEESPSLIAFNQWPKNVLQYDSHARLLVAVSNKLFMRLFFEKNLQSSWPPVPRRRRGVIQSQQYHLLH
jgi:hypothetical protein